MLKWIAVDNEYLDYLREKVDAHVPLTDYGEHHLKPFFGVLFETDQFAYVTQVSHPQDRHRHMKASTIFLKVFDQDKLICVVNLNYMFPIPKDGVCEMQYADIDQYRKFSSEKEKNNYVALLKKEIQIMQTMRIEEKACKLYRLCAASPRGRLAQMCMSFPALEEACKAYYQMK